MLSMMDHITKRLAELDKKNDDLYTEDTTPKLRFDRTSRQTKDDLIICGDVFVHSRFVLKSFVQKENSFRARSCHLLSHRVTGRMLTVSKAYEVNIDVSDCLDPVTKADMKVDFVSDKKAGKSKVIEKKNGIIGIRFMGMLDYWPHLLTIFQRLKPVSISCR